MKGKKSSVAGALAGAQRPRQGDPLDRVRLRRRHGLLGHGRLGAPQEDPGRRPRRGHGRQQGDLQPDGHLRPGRHPPGPDRPGPAEDAVGDPRLGRQLHGQPAVRRDRRADRRRPRPAGPPSAEDASDEVEADVLAGRARSSWAARPRTATPRSRRPASCSWTPAPSTRRTSPRMHEREKSVSTFMGNGLAIPHGTNEAKGAIRRTAISFVRYDRRWTGTASRPSS